MQFKGKKSNSLVARSDNAEGHAYFNDDKKFARSDLEQEERLLRRRDKTCTGLSWGRIWGWFSGFKPPQLIRSCCKGKKYVHNQWKSPEI